MLDSLLPLLSTALLAALQPGPLRCCPICCELAAAVECALPSEAVGGGNHAGDVDWAKFAADIDAAVLDLGATAEPHRELTVNQLVSLSTTVRCRLAAAPSSVSGAREVAYFRGAGTGTDIEAGAGVRTGSGTLAPVATVLGQSPLDDVYIGFARAIVAEQPGWSPAAARQLIRALASPCELSCDAVESALIALEKLAVATNGMEMQLPPKSRNPS